jgi:hypothetical protein
LIRKRVQIDIPYVKRSYKYIARPSLRESRSIFMMERRRGLREQWKTGRRRASRNRSILMMERQRGLREQRKQGGARIVRLGCHGRSPLDRWWSARTLPPGTKTKGNRRSTSRCPWTLSDPLPPTTTLDARDAQHLGCRACR